MNIYNKIIFSGLAALLIFSLSACYNRNGTNNGNPADMGTNTNQTKQYGMNRTGGVNGREGTSDNILLNPASNVQISQEIADQIAAMDEVDTANVMVTDHNAYIAVTLHPGSAIARTGQDTNATGQPNLGTANTNPAGARDVSQEIKDRIANKVRSTHPNIRNVYVSANPDFVERMNILAEEIRNGRPIEGLLNEFNNVIQRVFPGNSGHAAPNNPAAGR